MRSSIVALVSLAVASIPLVAASPSPYALSGENRHNYPRGSHAHLARRLAKQKRCKQRFPSSSVSVENVKPKPTSSAAPAPTSEKPADPTTTPSSGGGSSGGDGGGSSGGGSSGGGSSGGGSSGGGSSGGGSSGGGSSGGSGGVINVPSSCGDIGATSDVRQTSGPNGSIYWIMCGIDDGGWNPPKVTVNDIKYRDLGDALNDSDTPFGPCRDKLDLIYKYAGKYGVPPILVASIAMQESTCNPNAVGGGGEQGMMQISKDKCGNAPGGNCQDLDYNLDTGVRYLSDTINGLGGSLFEAIGTYNGFYRGITHAAATAAANSGCCRCQNNLDYIFQVVNGWMQGKNANNHQLGVFFNLDVCN